MDTDQHGYLSRVPFHGTRWGRFLVYRNLDGKCFQNMNAIQIVRPGPNGLPP